MEVTVGEPSSPDNLVCYRRAFVGLPSSEAGMGFHPDRPLSLHKEVLLHVGLQ